MTCRLVIAIPFSFAAAVSSSCGTDPGDASGWDDSLEGSGGLLSPGPDRTVLVAATDFFSGSYGVVDLDPPWEPDAEIGPAHSDAVARCLPGVPMVVGRLGADSLTLLDRESFEPVAQISLGAGANPQDVVAVDDRTAAVSLLGAPTVAFVDVANAEVVFRLDISAFADADSLPEAAPLLVDRGRLLVGLQRLDRSTPLWDPAGPGVVVVVDPASRTIVDADPQVPGDQAIALVTSNPAAMAPDPEGGLVIVASAGVLGDAGDGGLERVDPMAGRSLGLVVSGDDLGGDPMTMDVDPGTGALVITVYTPSGGTAVRRVILDSGKARIETLLETVSYRLTDARVSDRGGIWVADRDLDRPGVRVFDLATARELTESPLDFGLPPYSLCFAD